MPTARRPMSSWSKWLPDFLRYLAQMRLNPDGDLETLKPEDWLALREPGHARDDRESTYDSGTKR